MSTDLQILRDLESAGAISKTSITLPDDTPYPKVEALFHYFGAVSHALRWYIGDLINWGEGRYGDKVYQAADATGLAEGTLQNYASVCGRVAPERRREGLSFAIHQTVAYLEPAEQERWLERAEEGGWNVKQLRELLRDEGLIAQRPQPAWTPEPQRFEENGASLSAGSGVGDLAVTGAGPASESEPVRLSPESAVLTRAGVATSHPRVLAELRDRYERQIDATGRTVITVRFDLLERERDALNWALEQLAPELA